MSGKRKIILTILFVSIVVCTFIAFSYGYYNLVKNNAHQNVDIVPPNRLSLNMTNTLSSIIV